MNSARFDSITNKLANNWEFEVLFDFFNERAVNHYKQLEFCIYLADVGLLEELHKFISKNGLYNLKALASDPKNTYKKRDNAKLLFNIYESEMCAVFERQAGTLSGLDAGLLNISQYSDNTIIAKYIIKHKDVIFQTEQQPKTLMYLTHALNKALCGNTDEELLKLLVENFDKFKSLSAIRKAYITKLVALKLLPNKNLIGFPKLGYNELQKLLGVIAPQKSKQNGAEYLFGLVAEVIRPQIAKPDTLKKLGWDTNPRVAVCLSGMYRASNLALQSIQENIIDPLNADVFFHSWNEMQDWPGLGGAGDEWILRIFNKDLLNKCPPPLRSKKYFKEKFPRTYMLIDTATHSAFDPARLPASMNFKKIRLEDSNSIFRNLNVTEENFESLGSMNQAKMLYGIYKAHELAVEYEKEEKFRYDFIIRCRPDVGLHNKLSFQTLETLKSDEVAMEFNKMVGAQDQFWYGRREAALAMASLWAASVDSDSLSPFPDQPQLRAHSLIFGWMANNYLQPAHTPIRREMSMATAHATPPDFSTALGEDLRNEAYEFCQNREVLDFLDALLNFNKS